jgi:hypothetical protein
MQVRFAPYAPRSEPLQPHLPGALRFPFDNSLDIGRPSVLKEGLRRHEPCLSGSVRVARARRSRIERREARLAQDLPALAS